MMADGKLHKKHELLVQFMFIYKTACSLVGTKIKKIKVVQFSLLKKVVIMEEQFYLL